MNLSKKLFAIGLVMCGFATVSFAQVTATATATATIVATLTITKVNDMNFGNVSVSATAGTVILTPAGSRSATGGVTLPAVPGTVTAASFNVVGEGTYAYTVTLPTTNLTLTRNTGTETMIVNAFTSTPSGAAGALTGGAQTVTVGATLNVNGSQVPGVYVSGTPFPVTVNYN